MFNARLLSFDLRNQTRIALLALVLAAASFPLLAQQPDSPDQGDKTNSPSGFIPRQEAQPLAATSKRT